MERRTFIQKASILTLGTYGSLLGCKSDKDSKAMNNFSENDSWYQLSLAQWSLHQAIHSGDLAVLDFARKAHQMGFQGLEYVSQLYTDLLKDKYGGVTVQGTKALGKDLLKESEKYGLDNVLIMIDSENDLGDAQKSVRDKAIEEHKKWIDLAHQIGCSHVRTNLFGNAQGDQLKENCTASWHRLCEYAKSIDINVLVENHGWESSDPEWLVSVLKNVDMPNAGLLPDFGNFCVRRKDGERWGECVEEYPDIYKGIEMMMPYAKGVSAKSYNFNRKGQETKIDYSKMLKIVKDSGFTGYIGVEYEGKTPETEGIIKTKDLITQITAQLN